jgi:3-methylcrotonyl-CoA carboxylase beta subunit
MSVRSRTELMGSLVAELRERTALVARGGGEAATVRHRSRGKLPARERIDRLVDPGSAFLELNALAAWDMYDGEAPSAGIVTGIGVVEGRQCVVVANDATVKVARISR